MLRNTYPGQICSVARALEVVGERWTLLVVRDALLGVRRFDEFQRNLGVASNILSKRLERLCDEGILERSAYADRPPRYEYVLTEKGRDLGPVVVMLMKWGDRYYAGAAGPPRLTLHRDCGGDVDERLVCDRCDQRVEVSDLEIAPGPGLQAAES
jgi:DNA-binding HxlR family transcriptional regulator